MFKIGFMQGRLTEKNGFFPQIFPQREWEKEFAVGAFIGFQCIEWMFNADGWEINPIMTQQGIAAIKAQMEKNEMEVSSICANYYMRHSVYTENTDLLKKIIESANKLNVKNIILPLFESSDLESVGEAGFDRLLEICNILEKSDVKILIESDISMNRMTDFCKNSLDKLGICYDIGNAIGLGRDVIAEIEKYGAFIQNIHLKDKKIAGTTVMLGEGNAPFKESFSKLQKMNYQKCLILESYYENAVEDTKRNYNYIKGILEK